MKASILFFLKIMAPLLFVSFLNQKAAAQQKPQFTQYMFNRLLINPGYAGADEALSLTLVDRHQWSGVENAPITVALSAHTLMKKRKVGLGISIMNDRIGVHNDLNILTHYAYHLKTGPKSFLSMGIQAGFTKIRADYASLIGGAKVDPKLLNSIDETFFDLGAGVYFRSPKLQIGLSAPALIPQKISFDDTLRTDFSQTNYMLFAVYSLKLNEQWCMEPSVLLKYVFDLPFSIDLNINMTYRNVLTLGASYRAKESIDFLFKAQITPQLQFGYAYDYPVSLNTRLLTGSHELMLHYLFRYSEKRVASPR